MRYVQAEKPVTTQHEKLGKVEFVVEVPEAQSLDEAKQQCGGEEALLAFYNSNVATNAKNAARAYARTFEVAEGTDPSGFGALIGQITTEGQRLARDYSPAADTERGPSKAKKAAAFDQVAALLNSGQEFTREDLLAMLAKAK